MSKPILLNWGSFTLVPAMLPAILVALGPEAKVGFEYGPQNLVPRERALRQVEVEALLHERLRRYRKKDITELSKHLIRLCDQHELRPEFVLSLIRVESAFKPRVVSVAGAVGLMQVKPEAARHVEEHYQLPLRTSVHALKNPHRNITVGVHYLGYLKQEFGDERVILAAYNFGPTWTRRILKKRSQKLRRANWYVNRILNGEEKIRNEAKSLARQNRIPASI